MNEIEILEWQPLAVTIDDVGPFRQGPETVSLLGRGEGGRAAPSSLYMLLARNGRGKTTVLEMIYGLFGLLAKPAVGRFADATFPGRAQVDVRATVSVASSERRTVVLSLWTGSSTPLRTWRQDELSGTAQAESQAFLCMGRVGSSPAPIDGTDEIGLAFFRAVSGGLGVAPIGLRGGDQDLPTVLYFPADRTIVAPRDERVVQRPTNWGYQPAQRFRADGPEWRDSIDNLLVWLEWLDDDRLGDLLEFLNQELFSETPGKIIRPPNREELLTYVSMPTGRHPLSHLSQGERAILQLLARTICHMTRNTILLIDEVENHLHPKWMQRLIAALKSMIRREGSNIMVIFTTHNVELLQTFDHMTLEEGLVKGGMLIEEEMR